MARRSRPRGSKNKPKAMVNGNSPTLTASSTTQSRENIKKRPVTQYTHGQADAWVKRCGAGEEPRCGGLTTAGRRT